MNIMTKIRKHIDDDLDLTIYNVCGSLNPGEFIDFLEHHNNDKKTTRNLFDFTNVLWGNYPPEDIEADVAKAMKFSRKGAKAAYLLPKPTDFSLGKLLQVYFENEGYLSTIRIFQNIDDAREWLES